MRQRRERSGLRQAAPRARRREVDEQADRDFTALMEGAPFRAFVWRLLARAHLNETSFNRDPLLMAFAEGERNAGLALLHDIDRLCPRHYPAMAEEAARGDSQNPEEESDDD